MMNHTAVTPEHPLVASAVAEYSMISGLGPGSKMVQPRLGVVFILNLAGGVRFDESPLPVPGAIIGIREHPSRLVFEPSWIDRIQVVFHPGGLSRFAALDAAMIRNRVVSAEAFLAPAEITGLVRRLAGRRAPAERGAVLDRFFAQRYRAPSALEERVLRFARRIGEEPDASIGELRRDIPASLRHLERTFRRLVGVSPRGLARLARFQRARQRILAGSGESLTDVAFAAGYYDQAHLSREFRRLAAATPGSFAPCSPLSEGGAEGTGNRTGL